MPPRADIPVQSPRRPGIDIAVCVAEDAKVDVASVDFGEINPISFPLLRGDLLEKEHFEELAEDCILSNVGCESLALLGKFALDA